MIPTGESRTTGRQGPPIAGTGPGETIFSGPQKRGTG
jgi:hypothetical protein